MERKRNFLPRNHVLVPVLTAASTRAASRSTRPQPAQAQTTVLREGQRLQVPRGWHVKMVPSRNVVWQPRNVKAGRRCCPACLPCPQPSPVASPSEAGLRRTGAGTGAPESPSAWKALVTYPHQLCRGPCCSSRENTSIACFLSRREANQPGLPISRLAFYTLLPLVSQLFS